MRINQIYQFLQVYAHSHKKNYVSEKPCWLLCQKALFNIEADTVSNGNKPTLLDPLQTTAADDLPCHNP
jgi:hypothetical protein